MAVIVPWPEESQAALVTLKRHLYHGDVSEGDGAEDSVLELIGQTAAALVQDYAPGAPQPIKDLAAIRVAQFILSRSGANPSRRGQKLGDWQGDIEFLASQTSPLRGSGAMSLLSTYKRRTLGIST